jgi:predicted Zn-dependent protease
MSEPGHEQRPENESVRHLVELGYVDPDELASREAARRRQLQEQFRQAVELNRQRRGDEAATLLEKLTDDDPDWAAPRQLLAEIHYGRGHWDLAKAQLEWLAVHGVDNSRLALIAAGIATMRREYRSALEDLIFARYVDPNLPSVHTLLGTVLLRTGKWDEAEAAFRQAAEQNPTDAHARDGVAAVCLKHGEYEDAADWALRALEQDMQLFCAHYHLGLALTQLNRPMEAVQALETSARLDPTRLASYYRLSQIARHQLNDSAAATRYRERAREIIRQRRAHRGGVNATSA